MDLCFLPQQKKQPAGGHSGSVVDGALDVDRSVRVRHTWLGSIAILAVECTLVCRSSRRPLRTHHRYANALRVASPPLHAAPLSTACGLGAPLRGSIMQRARAPARVADHA